MSTKEIVVGVVELSYNENGHLDAAAFSPKISVRHEEIKDQLGDCTGKTIEQIKECAQLFLATFFNKVSDIELRDMENTDLVADINKQTFYDNGGIKDVEINFIYKQKMKNEN